MQNLNADNWRKYEAFQWLRMRDSWRKSAGNAKIPCVFALLSSSNAKENLRKITHGLRFAVRKVPVFDRKAGLNIAISNSSLKISKRKNIGPQKSLLRFCLSDKCLSHANPTKIRSTDDSEVGCKTMRGGMKVGNNTKKPAIMPNLFRTRKTTHISASIGNSSWI